MEQAVKITSLTGSAESRERASTRKTMAIDEKTPNIGAYVATIIVSPKSLEIAYVNKLADVNKQLIVK